MNWHAACGDPKSLMGVVKRCNIDTWGSHGGKWRSVCFNTV